MQREPEPKDAPEYISALQKAVAQEFFALEVSRGFVIAGGAALIAQGLVERDTDDLDLFTRRGGGDVLAAARALEGAANARGWTVERIRDLPEFVRLVIRDGDAETLVDLGVDSPPQHPPVVSIIGPLVSEEDAAPRKVLAIFGRTEPRDFVDCYSLMERRDKEEVLRAAADLDPGFDRQVFAQMMRRLERLDDDRLPAPAGLRPRIREFFRAWADEIDPR